MPRSCGSCGLERVPTALGFVELDFDPSAGQEVAALRLAQRFPDSGVIDEGALQDQLVRRLLEGDPDALVARPGGEPAAGSPRVDVHVLTDDGGRGAELLLHARDHAADAGADTSGFDVHEVAGGDTATSSTSGRASGGTLGDEELLRRTLPAVDDSGLSTSLDIDRPVEQADVADCGSSDDLSDEARRNIAPFEGSAARQSPETVATAPSGSA